MMQTNRTLVQAIGNRITNYISDSNDAKQSIKAVYLYGSVLNREKFRNNSDIDLAFLLDPSLYIKDPLVYSSPAYLAATEIGLMLNRQTDVIILNSASLETAYQAVTTGTIVYEADHDIRLEYEAALKGMYFDFKPFLQHLRAKSMLRRHSKEPGI